jgi:hypothetical protein
VSTLVFLVLVLVCFVAALKSHVALLFESIHSTSRDEFPALGHRYRSAFLPRKERLLRRSIARSFEEEGAPTPSSSGRRLMRASQSKRRQQHLPPPTLSDCNCHPLCHRSRPRATSIKDDVDYCNYCHVHHHHLSWNPPSAEAEATAADDAATDKDKQLRQRRRRLAWTSIHTCPVLRLTNLPSSLGRSSINRSSTCLSTRRCCSRRGQSHPRPPPPPGVQTRQPTVV